MKNFVYNIIMKDKKKLKEIAEKIIKLEKKCQTTTNKDELNKYLVEMNVLTNGLSIEDYLIIDEYILESNKLS